MRAAIMSIALLGGVSVAPSVASAQSFTCTREPARVCRHAAAPARHRHLVRYARAHVARAYHIPRFDQGEAEAFVHTYYPYRTGLYAPWPDAYGAPYPY